MAATSSLYDADFHAWLEEQARLVREGKLRQLDLEHLAEEIDDLGKNQRGEVRSRLAILLLRLVKCDHQPELRSRSWDATIAARRAELALLFDQGPSLPRYAAEALPAAYADALDRAVLETGLPREIFPAGCPFELTSALGRAR